MTSGQHSEAVEARADLILSGEATAEAFAGHVKAQLRRGMIRRLLYAGYVHLARSSAHLAGVDPGGTW